MSEALFDVAANQRRIRSLVTGITQVVFLPVVRETILHPGRREGVGWGRVEYRAGSDCLGSHPTVQGEGPAEIAFYPEVPELDIAGGVYWHGEGSRALRRGEIIDFYLDNTLVDGHFVNYVSVRSAKGQLTVGHVKDGELVPPTEKFVTNTELKIDDLKAHRQQELNDKLKMLTSDNKSFQVTASYLLDLAQRAEKLFTESDEGLQQKLLEYVLSNIELNDKKLSYILNDPFKTIVEAKKKSLSAQNSNIWCG